jgi:hypothetical protein
MSTSRLGFCVLSKFFELEGAFPAEREDVPVEAPPAT